MQRVKEGNVAIQQTASMEDYLETIALLSDVSKPVKVTEISSALGVKKPSVTSALTRLSESGLVTHKRYGSVQLTPEGEKLARDVYWRHETLRHFLVDILNIKPIVAEEDACRMEHVLSRASLSRLAKFIEFLRNCPQGIPECLRDFNYYLKQDKRDKELTAKCQGKNRKESKFLNLNSWPPSNLYRNNELTK
jgi:DtxR family Mn-dependent transcriptional regulator